MAQYNVYQISKGKDKWEISSLQNCELKISSHTSRAKALNSLFKSNPFITKFIVVIDKEKNKMTIEEFLKLTDIDARLTNGNKWLVYNNTFNEWYVYIHKPYQRQSTLEYNGTDLSKALEVLGKE